MNIITFIIGFFLVTLGVDGYFNDGYLTSVIITPNYDIAMTMIVTGTLVLAVGLCLCEFRGRKHNKPGHNKVQQA